MSILDLLNEKFFHADKVNTLSTGRTPVYVEIFSNPTPKEIIDLKKEYRLIRIGIINGELYAWRGNVLHGNALDVMRDKIGKIESWDYRLIYDPSKSDSIEVYGDDILSDGDALLKIKQIFPQVKNIISAETDELQMEF